MRARAAASEETRDVPGPARPFRGLALVFVLSFVNLAGVILTVSALGGPAPWSRWQFVGAFGALEAASGLANVVSPNLWRLPVAQLQTSHSTDVTLAASSVLLPHWGALARCLAGVVCLGLAGWQEGVGGTTLALAPLILAIAWSILAISALVARVGVARPERDVLQITFHWGGRAHELPPVSIGAAILQFLLSIATIPAVKLLSPSVLFGPELRASVSALLVAAAGSAILLVLVFALWSGRIGRNAPTEQQEEAEEHA